MATNSIRVKIIKRKDGFYWMVNGLSPEGPFTTKEEAEADAPDRALIQRLRCGAVLVRTEDASPLRSLGLAIIAQACGLIRARGRRIVPADLEWTLILDVDPDVTAYVRERQAHLIEPA